MKVGIATSFFDQNLRESKSRELVPATPARPPAPARSADHVAETTAGISTLPPPGAAGGADPRSLTPRQMSELSMDLYLGGVIGFAEYELLAFQPELHPDYNGTVGALTGRAAEPDQPRDFIAEWEDKLAFEREHAAADPTRLHLVSRIVGVLTQLADRTDVTV